MYPKEYIQFLAHFHGDRDYFECHEILEEYWKKLDSRDKESIWVGFILLAVSTYHHRRGNFNGAKKTIEKAIKIFELRRDQIVKLGLDPQLFHDLLLQRLSMVQTEIPYKSFELPICNTVILKQCKEYCEINGFKWGNASNVINHRLVHRHKLRDRSSVVQERLLALKMRKGNE